MSGQLGLRESRHNLSKMSVLFLRWNLLKLFFADSLKSKNDFLCRGFFAACSEIAKQFFFRSVVSETFSPSSFSFSFLFSCNAAPVRSVSVPASVKSVEKWKLFVTGCNKFRKVNVAAASESSFNKVDLDKNNRENKKQFSLKNGFDVEHQQQQQ